jgi:glycosyltransferase involved in cell wall biosynthesis
MKASTLKAIIFTKNEENNIDECIASLPPEIPIFVVDSDSSDQTRSIAEKAGATVLSFKWNGKYPRKKEWTRRQFDENDWLLLLDADLRCTPSLYQECLEVIESNKFSSALIPINYWFMGDELKHGSKPSYIGLINVGKCRYPDVELDNLGYGDIEFHYQPICTGLTAKLRNPINHMDRDPLVSWIDRHVKYANYQAQLELHPGVMREMNKNKTFRGKVLYRLPFRAIFQFMYSYFLKFGFLDGISGFRYSYLHAHHYYLARVIAIDYKKISTSEKMTNDA